MKTATPPPSVDAVCAAFRLGAPAKPLVAVRGGDSHRVWRLVTTRGSFAVKELNRDFDDPDYVCRYERAFRFELASFEAGVPMPRPVPVPGSGRCLAEVGKTGDRSPTIRVHEWVDGERLTAGSYTEEVAAEVGMILAQIHHLNVTSDAKPEDMLRVNGDAHWRMLTARLEASGVSWADKLRQWLPVIAALEAFVVASRADVDAQLLSHRDAHIGNVLITADRRLVLLDWDVAGPVSPRHEVAHALLDWSGVHAGEPAARLARALVAGYRRGGGEFEMLRRSDFGEFICVMVNWFEFNVRRTLGERTPDESARALGEENARRVLGNLPRFERSLDKWLALAP